MVLKYVLSTEDNGIFWYAVTTDSRTIDIPPCASPNNLHKVVVGKIDSNGNKEWVKMHCNNNPEPSIGCPPDHKGYVVGQGVTDTEDIFLRKLDCMGKIQWSKSWGSTRQDGTVSIIRTSDAGYLVMGVSGAADGDIPVFYGPPSSFNYWDWVVIKTDSLGNKQWIKVYGSSGHEERAGSIFEVNNYYYLVGRSDGQDHDCDDTSAYPQSKSYFQTYVIKMDTAGTVIWSKAYGRSVGDFYVTFDDRDSSILVSTSAAPGFAPYNSTNTFSDFGVLKIDLDGNLIWAKALGDNHIDYTGNVSKGPGNSYFVVGYSNSSQPESPPRIGYTDGWLFWLDSLGNVITDKFFGSLDHDFPGLIAPYKNGFAIVQGRCLVSNSFSEGSWNYTPGAVYGLGISHLDIWPTPTIDPVKNDSSFEVFPNPTKNQLTIVIPEKEQNGEIRIYDSKGKKQFSKKVYSGGTHTLNSLNLSNGTYIVTYQSVSGFTRSKTISIIKD